MGPGSITAPFAHLFPAVHQEVQKLIANWHNHLLKVSRIGMYLGREQMMVLSTFGHKLILNTRDINSLKPLLRPSASDLVMCALFPVLHTLHSSYLYVNPSSAFQPINLTALMKNQTNTLRVVSPNTEDLFDIAKNLHLNDLDERLVSIQSSYWQSIIPSSTYAPLQALEPYSRESVEQRPLAPKQMQRTFELFEKSTIKSEVRSLEELTGEDFMNLRAVIIERASFSQLEDSDLENMALLNPGCYWLVHLSAEDPSLPDHVFDKLFKARSLGYHIWQLPDFKPYELEKRVMPLFGKWLFLAKEGLI